MKLRSWNRFLTRALAVKPELMGCELEFGYEGTNVAIRLPPLSRVGGVHDESALATKGAWNGSTGDVIYYHVRSVDVLTSCTEEVQLPSAILDRSSNAFDLLDRDVQTRLETIARNGEAVASSAFEYWISLVRWVTGSHQIGREARSDHKSGWTTYLHESQSDKSVWGAASIVALPGVHQLSVDEFDRIVKYARSGTQQPMYISLLGDAKYCIDVRDYRRSLVDLSVACEVYLRSVVLDSLPDRVLPEVIRLVEEANINQYVAHMFPALLDESVRVEYKKVVRGQLDSLFARRNKLMHMALQDGAEEEACRRYVAATERLFSLQLRGKP